MSAGAAYRAVVLRAVVEDGGDSLCGAVGPADAPEAPQGPETVPDPAGGRTAPLPTRRRTT